MNGERKKTKKDVKKEKNINSTSFEGVNKVDNNNINIDDIDKVYKDIIEIIEKLQIVKQTAISGSPLEIEKKTFSQIKLKCNCRYIIKNKTLDLENDECFKGKIIFNNNKTLMSLYHGIYTWPSGETYEGTFNKNNLFDGKGIITKKGNFEQYIFESIFENGYPIKNGRFNLVSNRPNDLYNLYIQSDIIKNKDENIPFKLILSGKTNITKTELNKEENKLIYRFDGNFEEGKIIGNALIKKRYKIDRYVEIFLNSNIVKEGNFSNVILDMEINNIKGKKSYYKAKYKNGIKYGLFTLIDKQEDIKLENKGVDYENKLLKLYSYIVRHFAGYYFEKIKKYFVKPLIKFNRLYKVNINENELLIRFSNVKIDSYGMKILSQIQFNNLKELAINNSEITNISALENADYPQLESLSFSKNSITLINNINKFHFPKLQMIMLGFNKIDNISSLNKYKSENLKTLVLFHNLITDIKSLEKMFAPNLEQISLGSQIKDISVLNKCNFPKLKQLGLKGNKIRNISSLIDANFPQLEILYLGNNSIVDINPLKKAFFPNLINLGLEYNKIKDIIPLEYLKCVKLTFLNISNNNFSPNSRENKEIIEYLQKRIKNIKY